MRSIKNNFLIIVTISFFFNGCAHKQEPFSDFHLQCDTIIHSYSDSTFFSDIRSIIYYSNKYFLSDYERNQIVVLDTNLHVLETIGRKGDGPGEFNGLSHLYIIGDTIFAYNDAKRTIEEYYNEQYIKSINLPIGEPIDSKYSFFYNYPAFFYANSNDTSGICCYDIQGKTLSFFGSLNRKRSQAETRIKNCRYLFECKNKIISVSDYRHIIEIYDENLKLLTTYDYSFIYPAKRRQKYINTQEEQENNYFNILADASITENNLFLLLYSNTGEDVTCNTVLHLTINDLYVHPVRLLNLGDGFYGSLCATPGHLMAFDRKNGVLAVYNH